MSSIRQAAEEINSDSEVGNIAFIINNASIIVVQTFEVSEDGIEKQFASNHVRRLLLTNLLMGKFVKAWREARIVNVDSMGFELAGVRFKD